MANARCCTRRRRNNNAIIFIFCVLATGNFNGSQHRISIVSFIASLSRNSSIPPTPPRLENVEESRDNLTNEEEISKTCKLPPCSLVAKSRLFSERCNSTGLLGWDLLLTGTPRSATTYISAHLASHGMKIQDDWWKPLEHGRASWIFAFEDDKNFGPARTYTNGKTFKHIFHHVKDPLKSITAICTEPTPDPRYAKFLQKHVNMTTMFEYPVLKSRVILQFWVEWHTFLKNMRFPAYQIENVEASDIFQLAGLGHIYNGTKSNEVSSSHNKRGHRPSFNWQELYTIDPEHAAKAWDLAHYYNYSYPDVDFDNLTCLDRIPNCQGSSILPSICPPGTHPFPKDGKDVDVTEKPVTVSGLKGWVDDGCVEYTLEDGTIIGMPAGAVQAK
uniref:Uncharacterized protein n=1 Tax=Attheya septentrionalis TaxID=420275 RepID=A0A7S2UMH2_9STRA|mmetsp:Transcript_29288/g.53589  ORF Transcript_29288/g.53589 Transcript_29288/m.53589 type:complete len:388 (+) Transcript_29288:107-1270(+)